MDLFADSNVSGLVCQTEIFTYKPRQETNSLHAGHREERWGCAFTGTTTGNGVPETIRHTVQKNYDVMQTGIVIPQDCLLSRNQDAAAWPCVSPPQSQESTH